MRAASSRKVRPRRSRTIRPCRRSTSGAAMAEPILSIRDLQVYYGEARAIQGVELLVDAPVLSLVGRHGMGKTTLCNTIAALKRARSGWIRLAGEGIAGLEPHIMARPGIASVPRD